MATSKEMQYWQ